MPFDTLIAQFNATNGSYTDAPISVGSSALGIDSLGNYIINSNSPVQITIYDSGWGNPTSYAINNHAIDYGVRPGTNHLYIVSKGGNEEPYIEVRDTTNGQLVGSILDIWALNPGNQYINPYAIAVYPDGRFAISYYSNHMVVIYDAGGQQLAMIGDGNTSGPISYPWGLAIDDQNRLFIGNAGKGTVVVYNNSYSYYNTVATAEGFNVFEGIATNTNGSIVVITDNSGKKIYCYKRQ